jgi:hypothetical protein
MKLPPSENALLVRTNFANQNAWKQLLALAQEPPDLFIFNMEIVDDRANNGATAEQILTSLPGEYPHNFFAIADGDSMAQPDYALLVVDVLGDAGRRFRAVAAQIACIDNNLSIGNMGFAEFAESVDETGIFRGIPGI